MTFDALSAANAYRNQLKLNQNLGDSSEASGSADGSAFSKLVQDGLKDFTQGQYKAEELKLDSLTGGKVDLTELVAAVSSAELTLNTVVAVRDKVISAYQDIIRMPI